MRSAVIFFFQQKTAYEMRISDWSSDVCSSDLHSGGSLHRDGRRVFDRVGEHFAVGRRRVLRQWRGADGARARRHLPTRLATNEVGNLLDHVIAIAAQRGERVDRHVVREIGGASCREGVLRYE